MFSLPEYQWLNRCGGLEIVLRPDGAYDCRFCAVSIDKGSLTIDRKEEGRFDKASLFKLVPSHLPFALTLNGKGVLIRKVAKGEGDPDLQLKQYFPNLKPEEFYIQHFNSREFSYLAMVRKELLDGLLQVAEKAGMKLFCISLGPFPVSHILKQLNRYGEELIFDGHVLHYSGSEWSDYKYDPTFKSEFPLKVGIEPLKEQFLLAYATAFQLALYPNLPVVYAPVDVPDTRLDVFAEKRRFSFRVSVLLAVVFTLLLFNFLVFSYYSSENTVFTGKVNQDNASSDSINKLGREISVEEAGLKDLGWYRGISCAWIADQIGQSVSPAISLTEMSFNPLDATESNRARMEIFKTGRLAIRGEAAEPSVLNDWIYRLKDKPWVKQLHLERFSPSQEGDIQEFEISIVF